MKDNYSLISVKLVTDVIKDKGFYYIEAAKCYGEDYIGPEYIVATDDKDFESSHPEFEGMIVLPVSKFIELIESGDYLKDYDFLKGAQNNEHMLEGYLVPDTYSVPAGTSEDKIIRLLLDAHEKVFDKEAKAKAKKLKYSENEILIIASIIEKECADTGDQPIVASVIYNRLKIGMPLQMDSTIQYVLGLAGDRKDDLLYKDTEIESPYNTYTNAGLPAGPICCPGASAIKAALDPADTDYLYFVLDDKLDGKMAFSEDYEDFLKDKDAYYQARED